MLGTRTARTSPRLRKRTTLKGMTPADLMCDLGHDSAIKSWSAAWAFILEQLPLRKDPKPVEKKGVSDMDEDLAEQDKALEEDDPVDPRCTPCTGKEASTFSRSRMSHSMATAFSAMPGVTCAKNAARSSRWRRQAAMVTRRAARRESQEVQPSKRCR